MLEKVFMTISYGRLKNYLIDDLGYSERRAKWTIAALRKTNPRIQEVFLKWFYTAKLPEAPLFGVNIKALCDKRGLDPVTAFLTADWVSREPQAAVKALSRGHDTLAFSDMDAGYIQEIMNKNGWKYEEHEQKAAEDESDLRIN